MVMHRREALFNAATVQIFPTGIGIQMIIPAAVSQIPDITHKPVFIHSNSEPAFNSKKVRTFLQENNIEVSITLGDKNQNQVSE